MRDLPEGYSITLAEQEDIPALIAIDKAASALFEPTGLINPNALKDHVPAEVFAEDIPKERVFVARNKHGWPVGFVLISPRGNGIYLDQISVHPDHGQRGIGRELVMTVLAEAEHQKLPHVTLSTFRDLPWNGPFYASLGFREIPRDRLQPFMLEIERAQAAQMDVSARCFMLRKVRRPLFRFRRSP